MGAHGSSSTAAEQKGTEERAHAEWIEALDRDALAAALGDAGDPGARVGVTARQAQNDIDQPIDFTAALPGDPDARPDDLWERIRHGFALPELDNRRIREQRQIFTGREAFFNALAQRAEPYLYHIVEEIEQRDMPTELVALAIVESAFRPFAYSHGQAAGIWQFIPSTGQAFGLEMTYWYDGRRDWVAATTAALDYLESLAEMFDGDWLLAMAAYNAGQGTVRAAQRRAANAGQETDYWSLRLPAETMAYVPRILALRDILERPQTYRVSLPTIPNEPHIRIVDVGRQIDLGLAAELADLSMETLYTLNPGYNRWATAPDGPHRLVLPKENAERFEEALAEKDPDDFVEWRRHEVSSGETLSHIARQYNVSVDLVRQINDLNGDMLRAGDHLYVPTSSRPEGEYALSAANRLQRLQQRNRTGQRREHVVQSGETFWGIARRYNVGVRELAAWNGMAPGDTLRPQQTLVVWVSGASGSGGLVQASSGAGGNQPNERLQAVTYTVRSGDSLARIAQRFNVSVRDIKRWNNVSAERYLQPGERLQLKVDVTRQSSNI
ncbi:lytic transglycosylase [Halorhodospira abdelmalekii]|nr:LysM peptidoglycan-binding domain-containing protein [Halorhodospira abdelmalekii]MBK1735691.1 lytic transglycosylase [Halorhodospira abdelmalekii]